MTSLFRRMFRRRPTTYRKPARRARLGIESLEARETPAAATLSAGVLTVTAATADWRVTAASDASTVTVQSFNSANASTYSRSFNRGDVAAITFQGTAVWDVFD